MRIAVLGANGQIGAPVLHRLALDYPDAEVIGGVRKESLATMESNSGEFINLLAFNPFADNWSVLGKLDVLINCIGIIKETQELDFNKAHLGLTRLMLQHREQLGNPKIIQLSALGAETHIASKFLSTKALADQELLQHSDTVVVRPSIVCTPNTMLSQKLQMIKKLCRYTGGILPVPNRMLKTKLQPVAIDDLTELISRLCAIDDQLGVIEVGGRDVFTLKEFLAIVPTCKVIVPFPQFIFDLMFPLVSSLFPSLLDKEQRILLKRDNVTENEVCGRLLGREMASTVSFWKTELQ